MINKFLQPEKYGSVLSLNVAIGLVDIGKEASSMTPAPAGFAIRNGAVADEADAFDRRALPKGF